VSIPAVPPATVFALLPTQVPLTAKQPDVILKPCAAVFVALPLRLSLAAERKPANVDVALVFVALKVSAVKLPPKKPLPLTESVVNGEEVPMPTKPPK
jgi:hypothetical protein